MPRGTIGSAPVLIRIVDGLTSTSSSPTVTRTVCGSRNDAVPVSTVTDSMLLSPSMLPWRMNSRTACTARMDSA